MFGSNLFMRNHTVPLAMILACVFAGFGASPALAAHEGDVAVGGEWLLTIRAPAAGMSIRQRADAVQSRLVTILSNPNLKPSDIVAVRMGKNAAKVMVKDQLLVTATADAARLYHTTPIGLARHWAKHLRKVLPRINAKPNSNLEKPMAHRRAPRHP